MKVLVIFGSKSDEKSYKQIASGLKKNKINFDLRILSAHRTPNEIDAIDLDSYSLIIAGAGLSAALPGVVASKTIRPVIGVPMQSNYQGLDALLSIMQMPSGIPVLSVGVEKTDMAVQNAVDIMKDYKEITIIGNKEENAVQKAVDILKKFNIKYKIADQPNPETVNIEFTFFDEPLEEKDELVIYCPMLIKDDDKAEAALNILNHSIHGLWVGLNNGKNAAIAAIEILNNNDQYTKQLKDFKNQMKEEVIKADKLNKI